MLVKQATSRAQAERVATAFRAISPSFAQVLDKVGKLGAKARVVAPGIIGTAVEMALVPVDDKPAFEIRWEDGSELTLAVSKVLSLQLVAPELPKCETFVGAGVRCQSCRIRKAMHA